MGSRKAIINDLHDAGLLSDADAATLGAGATPINTLTAVGTAVADPAGGATVDTECRAQLADLLAELRTLGVIAT